MSNIAPYTLHATPPEITPDQKWSGTIPIPAVGSRVKATMNGWGDCTVIGYFTEGGWIGIRVLPDTCPDFFLSQNADELKQGDMSILNNICFFGAEIKPSEQSAPKFTARHQVALAIVKAKYRNWRETLHTVWMNGAYAEYCLEDISHLLQQLRNAEEGWKFTYGSKGHP
jgi:hypothetical protein